MAEIKFTSALNRFFPDLKPITLQADNVEELFRQLNTVYPGVNHYILNDLGEIREHVNLYIDNELVIDLKAEKPKLNHDSQVHIVQALSGG